MIKKVLPDEIPELMVVPIILKRECFNFLIPVPITNETEYVFDDHEYNIMG